MSLNMENLRPLLTTYAYNILGVLEDAQDVTQEAYLRFIQADSDKIENKRAYLIRSVINLSINQKKRQQKIVADYYGEWLPEPIASEQADSGILKKELLSYSLMVLLEKLNPKQRAVFILKEAFDYDHQEIAAILNISPENSRKLLSRSRAQLGEQARVEPNKNSSPVFNRYLDVLCKQDVTLLHELLHEDITVTSDGGGKARAGVNPIVGKKNALKMLAGLYRKFYQPARLSVAVINGEPALMISNESGVSGCMMIEANNLGEILNVFIVRNPDKLKFLNRSLSRKWA